MNEEIESYCNSNQIHKLHIGCGRNILHGWLNTDISPYTEQVIKLDGTNHLPFKESSFDYIFSEHMIEHVDYADGSKMLSECYRILKTGGKIRISTPNMKFLIDLYQSEDKQFDEYISWTTNTFNNEVKFDDKVFVINNFFYDWGHKFIYDDRILKVSLKLAGFKNIKQVKILESEDENLQGLENIHRMPKDFVEKESIILEAIK